MIHDLTYAEMEHASNLGALIAVEFAEECQCPAYIADPVVADVTIGITPFAIILVGIATFIALSIGHRIWRAANENPSEVIKTE